MGEVYEGFDLELRQSVALKFLRAQLAADRTAMQRFRREIALARRVTHPNVCRIFDLGTHRHEGADHVFLTMELLRGETLESKLRRDGRMGEEQALPIVVQMAEALAAAHEAGVVHRDFKSANVILVPASNGVRAVVTDFGLARTYTPEDGVSLSVTGTDLVVGTASYMAPEQAEGFPAGPRSDLYSLGVVIYEMVTGVLPHSAPTPMAILVKRLKEPPRTPRAFAADLSLRWEAAILRCLELRPEDRFDTGDQIVAALKSTEAIVQPPSRVRRTSSAETRLHTVLLLRIDGLSEHDLERAKRLVKEFTEERGGRIAAPSGRTLASVFLRPADGVAAALLLQEALAALAREAKARASIRASLHLGEVVLEEEPGAPPGISGNALRTAVRLVNAARPGQVLLSAATMGLARDGLVEDDELSPRVRWKSYGAWKLAEDAEPLEICEAGLPGLSALREPDRSDVIKPAAPKPARARLLAGLSGLVALLVLVAFTLGRRDTSQRPPEIAAAKSSARRSVAVLGFKNLSSRPDVAWLSTALSEMLSAEIGAAAELRSISGENVARARQEMGLPEAETLAKDSLEKLHTNLGADLVIVGSFVVIGEGREAQLRLILNLQDTVSGETVASVSETGTEAQVLALSSRAGARLRDALGASTTSPVPSGGARGGLPVDVAALKAYSEGLSRLRAYDLNGARGSLEEAVRRDPRNPLAHSALAEVWSRLGYDGRAREASLRSFEQSDSLAREEKLLVEGRHYEFEGEWGKAEQSYRTLSGFFSDNVDYGLLYARALVSGARTREALGVLASLRGLPPPASEDPRIDLAEAAALNQLGNARGELSAATRAVAKSTTSGATVLLAQARLAQGNAHLRLGAFDKARESCEESRRLFAEAGDRNGEGLVFNRLANVEFEQGHYAEAESTFRRAFAAWKSCGNRSGMERAIHNVADSLLMQGRLEDARANFQESLALQRELGNRSAESLTLANLAETLLREGRAEDAAAAGEEAVKIARETGYRYGLHVALWVLANVRMERLETAEARKLIEEGLLSSQAAQDPRWVGEFLFSTGKLAGIVEDRVSARKKTQEALEERANRDGKGELADSRLEAGRLSVDLGRGDEAREHLGKALELFRALSLRDGEAAALAQLARLGGPEARSRIEEAERLMKGRENVLTRGEIVIAIARARAGLGDASSQLVPLAALEATARKSGLTLLTCRALAAQVDIARLAGRGSEAEAAARKLSDLAGGLVGLRPG